MQQALKIILRIILCYEEIRRIEKNIMLWAVLRTYLNTYTYCTNTTTNTNTYYKYKYKYKLHIYEQAAHVGMFCI